MTTIPIINIMSGSPRGDDIVDHHLPYFQWLKTCDITIFGIYAGHHITGKLYGARLLRSKKNHKKGELK